MIMKLSWRVVALACCAFLAQESIAKEQQFMSPQKKISATVVGNENGIQITASANGERVFTLQNLGLSINGKDLRGGSKITSAKKASRHETLRPVVPMKSSTVESNYTQVTLKLKNGLNLELRLMDNAIAYRFVSHLKGDMVVDNEFFNLKGERTFNAHVQPTGNFGTSYEEGYQHMPLSEWSGKKALATTPLLLSDASGKDLEVLVAETNVMDYPRMFYQGDAAGGFKGVFPHAIKKWEYAGDRGTKILEEYPYIAKTTGSRNLPWRYFVITDSKGLPTQTVAFQLAGERKLQDVSWVKPGKVAWDWWNGRSPYGEDVNFKAGCNQDTYKYNIDFASKYGLEYILLDEGWAAHTTDPYQTNGKIDLKELVEYGKQKGVGVFLWLTWQCVHRHPELFQKFSEMGIAGLKIDFMDRSDQLMVNFYEQMASEAAKYHILVDLHGAFTPSGLEYIYPNLLTYEGVRGMEQMAGCRPDNNVYLPFIRNAVGAMDFTPGAMINMQPNVYSTAIPNAAAMGTRAFNMAEYVIYESGLQMLSDNATNYYRNEDCGRFIAQVPVTWDETKVLDCALGKYIILARRKGNKWFLGGINGSDKDAVNTEIPLSLFLKAGANGKMTIFVDGPNADWQAMDYRKKQEQVTGNSTLNIKMVRNGGFAAVIEM